MRCRILYSLLLTIGIYSSAFAIDSSQFNKNNPACIPGKPETSNYYMATKWYLDSPAAAAIYNEVFTMGLNHIQSQVKAMPAKDKPWGVVFDIDETVLNNMQYAKTYEVMQCKNFSWDTWRTFMHQGISIATPGATNITCTIKKLGGKVILVTNRPKYLDKETIENLNKVGICYDNVILSQNEKDHDKNSRFNAVLNGQYTEVAASNKKLPALNILAYFGDNIQDFPAIHQKEAIAENANSDFFKQFGTKYFSLSNPVYGSWVGNGDLDESKIQITKPLPGCTKGIARSSNLYWAAKWYLYSAEVKAQYNEIFNNAYQTIQNKVTKDKLKSGEWGAVFAINSTLLANPTYLRDKAVLGCMGTQRNDDWYEELANDVATPGAKDITCNIRSLGGHIVLVTDRNINVNKDILSATINTLHKNGICFDKILFSSTKDQEKDTRFKKVASKMDIVAYFGSQLEDFPATNKSQIPAKFGVDYFMLPNPININLDI